MRAVGVAVWVAVAALAGAGARAQGVVSLAPLPPAVAPSPPPLTPADGAAIETAVRGAPEFPAPTGLEAAIADLDSGDPAVRADADAALTKAAIELAAEERGRLVNPTAVDPDWALRPPYDAAADFAQARSEGRVSSWAESLVRRDTGYLDLLGAWRRYEELRAGGGWGTMPTGTTLARGAKGPLVARLRERLAKEGYADANAGGRSFDAGLAAEVADFQHRHDLKATGALTAETIEALNVPAGMRLATIDANLERARWLPDVLPADRIEADIAAQTVTLFRDGRPNLNMRAIVGDTTHLTPLFASRVSAIEFNPAWHVPTSIAKAELFPKEERAPGYFAKHGFSMVNGQLVQHAGPSSALGRIKFEMPNPFSVYLHDTPGRTLFARDSRGRSHGCVRVEKPRELAVALLAGQGWTLERVDGIIAKSATQWATPVPQVPVFLVYRTAWAVGDAPVIFRPDIYGWDDKLISALTAAR